MKDESKKRFYKLNHTQNVEYHRKQAAIVFDFVQHLKNQQTISEIGFKHTRADLIKALYDVLFAANRQMDYRQWLHDMRTIQEPEAKKETWIKKIFKKGTE